MQNKFLLSFLFLIFAFSPFYGQSNYETQIKKGISLAYNFQDKESERVFSKAMELSPERPEAYMLIAQNHLWAFIGSKDKTEYKIFNRWCDLAIDKAKTVYNGNRKDYKINYLLGKIYLLRAMAEGTDNSSLSAFSSSKSSFSYFETTLELNPKFYDSYRGLALFHYAVDLLPGVIRFAAGVGGIKGDREKAFDYMRNAYKYGYEDKTENAFHHAKMFTDYAGEYDSAMVILKPLLAQFPQNPVFNYQAGVILIKSGDFAEADKYLNKVIQLNHPSVAQMNALSLFLKGDICFFKNDFQNGEKYYLDFLDKSRDADYSGIANYRLAICAFINGKKDLYKKALYNAREGNNDILEDEFACRKSEQINGRDLTPDEILVIKAGNESAGKRYSVYTKALQQGVNSIGNRELKAEAYTLLADYSIGQKKLFDGERYLRSADSLGFGKEKWLEPKTLYLKAYIEYMRGNFKKALEWHEKAMDENDYEFKNEIGVMLTSLKRKILKK